VSGLLHVLFVTATRGSAWESTCLLAGALPQGRFQATVGALEMPDALARAELLEVAPHANLAILEGRDDADFVLALEPACAKLLLLCERARPALVQVNELALGRLPLSVPVVVQAASDALSSSHATGKRPAGDVERYRSRAREALLAASVVVAPSAARAREVERTFSLADGVRVIREGVPAPSRSAADRGLCAIACSSEEDPDHHVELLSQIASRLPGPVGIVAPRDGRTLPPPLVSLVGLSRRDLLALMAGTKVFVGLSRHDPRGLTAALANASGARLVLLDTPAHRELWPGRAELARDATSLARAIARAHAAPKLPRPPAPRYAIGETAAAYARLYEEVVSAPRAAA